MKQHKILDKFRGWALREPTIKRELLEAEEEFFFWNPRETLEDSPHLAGLFVEWFLFDRPVTSFMQTPAQLFLSRRGPTLEKDHHLIAEALCRSVFGLFEIEEVRPDAGLLRARLFKSKNAWLIRDQRGSQSLSIGQIVFARVIPSLEEAIFSGWVMGYPQSNGGFEQAIRENVSHSDEATMLHPRDVLSIFQIRDRWEDLGSQRLRAKLASLWQRWNPSGLSFKEFDAGIGAGDETAREAGQEALLNSAPNIHEGQEACGVLFAYWNLEAGRRAGQQTPREKSGGSNPGPVEQRFLNLLLNANMKKVRDGGKSLSPDEVRCWLRDPAQGEDGKPPVELIADERRQRGHPHPEQVDYHLELREIAASPEKKLALDRFNEANVALAEGRFGEALAAYEDVYERLKGIEDVNFRLLGNMGMCYAMVGQKDKGMKALQAALRINPDYELARGNLSLLRGMNQKDYEEFQHQGVKRMVVRRDV